MVTNFTAPMNAIAAMAAQELFHTLVSQHGEKNGGIEEFRMIDAETIGCRYGDTVIRLTETGWRYGSNSATYPTPAEAYESRRCP